MIPFNVPPYIGKEYKYIKQAIDSRKICGDGQFTKKCNEKFEEIIFAFKPSIEGETTTLYIKRVLEGLNIKISRLASGVPIGADIEYVDGLTLEKALNDRITIE